MFVNPTLRYAAPEFVRVAGADAEPTVASTALRVVVYDYCINPTLELTYGILVSSYDKKCERTVKILMEMT